jgi:steroid delta-isomerase-like uncharacterized protein
VTQLTYVAHSSGQAAAHDVEMAAGRDTAVEQNVALFRRVVDEFINGGNLGLANELFAPGFVNHSPNWGMAPDRAGLKQYIAEIRTAFPDLHMQIEDIVAGGDKVVVRFTCRGTHRGAFAGIPPTGRQLRASGFSLLRMQHGQVIERWNVQDNLETLQSLGATITLPEPG